MYRGLLCSQPHQQLDLSVKFRMQSNITLLFALFKMTMAFSTSFNEQLSGDKILVVCEGIVCDVD